MIVYRVFPFDASAAVDQPGGPLYAPEVGYNRVDSPTKAYRVLYVGDCPEAAIAEAFGAFLVWDAALIEAAPALRTLPRSRFALATYEIDALYDMDDPAALTALGLRPSDVVTCDRSVTQAWAERVFETGAYSGVSWWSYYSLAWKSIGVWDIARLRLVNAPRLLMIGDPAVATAATTIMRQLRT